MRDGSSKQSLPLHRARSIQCAQIHIIPTYPARLMMLLGVSYALKTVEEFLLNLDFILKAMGSYLGILIGESETINLWRMDNGDIK